MSTNITVPHPNITVPHPTIKITTLPDLKLPDAIPAMAPPMAPTMTPPAPPGSSGSPSRNGLLKQIQNGKQLKKTVVPNKNSTSPVSSVMGLTPEMQKIRHAMQGKEEEKNTNNEDPTWAGGRRKTRKNRKRRKTQKRRKNNKRRTKKNLKYIKR